jgi:hypothetical protein
MPVARTWKLQINLDAVNAGYLSLTRSREKADFLDGMVRGMNLGAIDLKATKAMTAGFLLGQESRLQAESFRQAMKTNGEKGGRPPMLKKGSKEEPLGFLQETCEEPNPQSPIKNSSALISAVDGSRDSGEFNTIRTTWNDTLVPQGYSECTATPQRMWELKRRLKEDADFLENFKRAIAYLAVEPYWREKAGALTVDFFLRPGKAKEFSEKKPTIKAGRVDPTHLNEVTEEYLAGRRIGA